MTLSDFSRVTILRKLMTQELTAVESCHEAATGITSHLTGMPGGGVVGSKIENAVIRAEVHYERYCRYCDELNEICTRMQKEFIKLNEDQRKVIDMYYLQNIRVGGIAKEMNITERHVFRIKKEAIQLLCSNFLA